MTPLQFPEHPYRGLAPYDAAEAMLFAGRGSHVQRCASILSQAETRILLLHGQTGCGKSSFLRAGLIPALEQHGFGYLFLRHYANEDDKQGQPVFIRCTADPLAVIALE